MTASILNDVLIRFLCDQIGRMPRNVTPHSFEIHPGRWYAEIRYDGRRIWHIQNVSPETVMDVLDVEVLLIGAKIRELVGRRRVA